MSAVCMNCGDAFAGRHNPHYMTSVGYDTAPTDAVFPSYLCPRHGPTQLDMENNLPPLRRVVESFVDDLDLDRDVLVCGHTILAPTDIYGSARPASRRRCYLCRAGVPVTPEAEELT